MDIGQYSPARRLEDAAHGRAVDRPPCICPGGMMNMMDHDIMVQSGIYWPQAHYDAQSMAGLAVALRQAGGFENYGVPFCVTVEAEGMGAKVDMGSEYVEPHVVDSPLSSVEDLESLPPFDFTQGRAAAVLEAIRLLKARGDGVPVIGNICGPVSAAGTLIDMAKLLVEFLKKPEASHRFMQAVTDRLIPYARAQAEAGADAICLSEPSGTGEILGLRLFRDFTVRYVNKVLDAADVPVKLVHICGKLRSVYKALGELHCDAVSVDSMVNLSELRPYIPGKALMGNVSTHALATMDADKLRALTQAVVRSGADILAPACGIPISTPLDNIRAMVAAGQGE